MGQCGSQKVFACLKRFTGRPRRPSQDDAKKIASESLEKFSDDVKNFYDIEYIITKNDEKGTEKEVTDENGKKTTTTVKEFPIMGYKNSKNKEVVW